MRYVLGPGTTGSRQNKNCDLVLFGKLFRRAYAFGRFDRVFKDQTNFPSIIWPPFLLISSAASASPSRQLNLTEATHRPCQWAKSADEDFAFGDALLLGARQSDMNIGNVRPTANHRDNFCRCAFILIYLLPSILFGANLTHHGRERIKCCRPLQPQAACDRLVCNSAAMDVETPAEDARWPDSIEFRRPASASPYGSVALSSA